MDKLAELSHGAKVVLGAAVALLVVSFFNWLSTTIISVFATMWNGIGVLRRPSGDRANRLAGDRDS